MGWQVPSRVGFLTLVFSLLLWLMAANDQNASGVSVKLLDTPSKITQNTTAAFSFARDGACGWSDSTIFICKLDDSVYSDCDIGKATYFDLDDGLHIFEVHINGSCKGLLNSASYNWIIDVAPPTAKVLASTPSRSDLNVSVNISFSKPCSFGGSFGCFAADSCNLKVQGPGEVIPSSLEVVVPNRKYKLLVSLASNVEYGQVNLSMGEGFCADAAGKKFTPTPESTFLVKFDRRIYSSGLSSRIPAKRFEFNSTMVEVNATNNKDDLKFHLYFSQPVVNTSAQILNALNTSEGTLVEGDGRSLGNQTFFPFMVTNVSSSTAIITVSFESHSIITGQGIAVSPIEAFTFLYDVERPNVELSTSTFRTREDNISIKILFSKPVLNFSSSNITISGGHLLSFLTEKDLMSYAIEVKADDDRISVNIPENTIEDLAGNKNLPSNHLVVRHDYTSAFPVAVSSVATSSFLLISVVVGLLAVSTANLQVSGALPSSGLTLQPSSNLFRMLCYIQVFALSRRLMETPNVYNELTRSLQWSIPHYSLPWEGGKEHIPPSTGISKKISILGKSRNNPGGPAVMTVDSGTAAKNVSDSSKIKAAYSKEEEGDGWKEMGKIMKPLAITQGSILLVHCLLVLLLKLKRKKKNTEKPSNYGALTFPRIEIFLLLEAVAGVCEGSAALIHGGTTSGYVVGSILLVNVLYVLLALLFFLLVGATKRKLLQYKVEDVRQEEGQQFDFYRLILGPGEHGQWTWKGQANSVYLTMFGILFEDLRGPPSQILDASRRGRFITFKNATWKMLQSLSIYYILVELIKRVCLGLLAGDYLRNCFYTAPAITMLCINSFQLCFLVLGQPFIERRSQLVNIIAVASEVGLYASGVALHKKDHKDDSKTGYLMVVLFLAGMLVLLANEVYNVYNEVKKLDHPDGRSFFKGSKVAMEGLRSFFTFSSSTPQPEAIGIEARDLEKEAEAGPSSKGNGSSLSKSSFKKSKKTTDPLAVAPLAAISNLEDAKSESKDAEEIGSSPFTDNVEAQIEEPLPLEAIPSLEAASIQTQTREDAKSTSKDAEEIGSAPSSKNIM